jgi:DNA gyrase subunit A
LAATVTDGSREFIIATKTGQSIRFDEQQVRAMGRAAGGVKAIELSGDDQVVSMAVTEPGRDQVLSVCARGFGKRTPVEDFRPQNRGGKGIIAIDTSERNGPLVGICLVKREDEVMLVTDRGQTIRTRVAEIRETGRNAQGVRVMNVEDDERVVAIEPVGESADDSALDAAAEAAQAAPVSETNGALHDGEEANGEAGEEANGQSDSGEDEPSN